MKKIILFTLAVGMIAGCTEPLVNKEIDKRINVGQDDFKIVQIEGCEYVIKRSSGSLIHKGNCKNPIHKGGNK